MKISFYGGSTTALSRLLQKSSFCYPAFLSRTLESVMRIPKHGPHSSSLGSLPPPVEPQKEPSLHASRTTAFQTFLYLTVGVS